MLRKMSSLVAGVYILFGLAACQTTEEKPAEGGPVNLTRAEAISHITDNTEVWSKGGGYYAPDGTLMVLWEGKESAGTWEVNADGEVCYVVEIWGSKPDCHRYVNDGGEIMMLYQGNARVLEIKPGNQLGSL